MRIVDMLSLHELVNLGSHSCFKLLVELFLGSVERTFNKLEDTLGELDEWLAVQHLSLGSAEHHRFKDNLVGKEYVRE
jgi:hypothetical protein